MRTGRPRGRPPGSGKGKLKASAEVKSTTTPPPVPSGMTGHTRKGSGEEIVERRQKVMRLRLRGVGYREIAKILNISPMTIKRDLDVIRDETSHRMSKLERDIVLAQSISVYEEIETQAWNQFNEANEGSQQRAHFLNVVRAARNDQTKLLMDIGLIQKTPQEVKHTVTSKVIESWTPAAQDLVALAIIKAGLTPVSAPVADDHQLPANVPSIIDATASGEMDEDEEEDKESGSN